MKSNGTILEQTPSLHRWLGQKLSKKGITQQRLAKSLGRTTPQVNRWISGKEAIPQALFLQAVFNTMPEELKAARHLYDVHQLAKLLPSGATHIVSSGGNNTALAAAKVIGKRAEESAANCGAENAATQYEFLSHNIGAGLNVLNMMKVCVEDDKPFIDGGNIELHLRFPHNLMAGAIIKFGTKNPQSIEEAHGKILRSMRQSIKNTDNEDYSDHVRQHTFHMLALIGDAADRSLVLDITSSSKDLSTKRTAYYAQIINNPNPQAADRFLYALERDPALTATTLEFDLIHYGDKRLNDTTPFKKSIENIIVHNLRHIQTHQNDATAQIAMYKLLNLLGEHGGRPFDRRRLYPRIRKILERFQIVDYVRLTPVERRFLNQFSKLLDNSGTILGPRNSDDNQLMLELN